MDALLTGPNTTILRPRVEKMCRLYGRAAHALDNSVRVLSAKRADYDQVRP